MDIEYIILITDSLVSVMKTVDLSVYFRQAYSQAIYFVIRLFFCGGFGYKIEFWNCPSKAEQFLYQMVYNNMTNTRVAAKLYLVASIDALYSKSVTLYLDI